MQIRIISIAQKMPEWVDAACADYQRRLPPDMKLNVVSLPLVKPKAGESTGALKQRESALMLQKLDLRSLNIALDEQGRNWSSVDWSKSLDNWRMEYPHVSLLIGGPHGLSQECLDRCRYRVALGRMTMPHALVRVVLHEQLYRAWTILQGHPYHRA